MVKEEKTFSQANGHKFVQIILLMLSQQLQTRTQLFFLQFETKKKTIPLKREKVACKLIIQDSKRTKLGVKENTLCEEKIFSPSKTFANVMRGCDLRFYTGFINTESFQSLFKYLYPKASTMRCWDGVKKTSKTSTFGSKLDDILSSSEMDTSLFNYSASKPGASRKPSIENEFL